MSKYQTKKIAKIYHGDCRISQVVDFDDLFMTAIFAQ